MIAERRIEPLLWPTDVHDACGNFFGQALRAFDPVIPLDAHVLEIGCAEFDWLTRAKEAWPKMTFTGIDWRPVAPSSPGVMRMQQDVLTMAGEPSWFDWIVSISAIEHIGLGHYDRDPIAEDGDSRTMLNAARWLKLGGWMYLDVPYNPARYEVVGTSHRVYDEAALRSRLIGDAFTERWRGVAHHNTVHELIAGALPPVAGGGDFFYCGLFLQKV